MKFDGLVGPETLQHAAPGPAPEAGRQRPPGLAVLRDWDAEVPAARWSHQVVAVEPGGRVMLPAEARADVRGPGPVELRGVCRGRALLLRPAGPGSAVRVDARGRFALPAWLRQAAGSSVLVAARHGADGPMVLVAPSAVIDGAIDALLAGDR